MSKIHDTIKIPVIRAKILGVNVYRGYAPLHLLADMSKADIYDQVKNPQGTQRDLSPKHAKDAYEYVKNNDLGFWPEIFLSSRQNDILQFTPINEDYNNLGILEIDINTRNNSSTIKISRVDGNHRLHYADGKEPKFSKIEKPVSFCLAYNITREEEIKLFKDINKNQKAMNTSHLDGIDVRLSPEEELKRRQPDLYIAQKLGSEFSSPLNGRIYDGGKKPVGVDVPLRSLRTGIQYMLSRSTQLPRLNDAEAQFKVIRNYFSAVKLWQPEAWKLPKEHILLRGAGLWAICFLGAQVIDRALLSDKFKTEDLLRILNSGKSWDWSNKGSFKGYSGRGGALEISIRVGRHLKDSDQLSTDELFKEIMSKE